MSLRSSRIVKTKAYRYALYVCPTHYRTFLEGISMSRQWQNYKIYLLVQYNLHYIVGFWYFLAYYLITSNYLWWFNRLSKLIPHTSHLHVRCWFINWYSVKCDIWHFTLYLTVYYSVFQLNIIQCEVWGVNLSFAISFRSSGSFFSACFHWVDKKLPRVENRFSTRGNFFANVLDRAELFALQRWKVNSLAVGS